MTNEIDYDTKKEQERNARLSALHEDAASKARHQATWVMNSLAQDYSGRIVGSYGNVRLETEDERDMYRRVLYEEFFEAMRRERDRLGITRPSAAGAI